MRLGADRTTRTSRIARSTLFRLHNYGHVLRSRQSAVMRDQLQNIRARIAEDSLPRRLIVDFFRLLTEAAVVLHDFLIAQDVLRLQRRIRLFRLAANGERPHELLLRLAEILWRANAKCELAAAGIETRRLALIGTAR